MLLIQLVSIALVALAASGGAQGRVLKKEVPILVKTLKDLHRGPPKQTVLKRLISEEKWITQPLDHFDESNDKTFQMVCRNNKKRKLQLVINNYNYELLI